VANEISLDEDVAQALDQRAELRGAERSKIANDILRAALKSSKPEAVNSGGVYPDLSIPTSDLGQELLEHIQPKPDNERRTVIL
jgi:metal-responsive CopG/Arc/MetJ family transcriptional regulator